MKSETILLKHRLHYKIYVKKFTCSNCDHPYSEASCVAKVAAHALKVSKTKRR